MTEKLSGDASAGRLTERDTQALRLVGELDVATGDELGRRLREHVAADGSSVVVVDLSGVTFIDSSGLDPLLRVEEELVAADRLLVLRAPSPAARRLFRCLCRLQRLPLLDRALGWRPSGPDVATAETVDAGGPDLEQLTEQATQLQGALQGREVLNQAKGLLMGLHGCDADQAWTLLMLISQHRNVNVRDLAAGIVAVAAASAGDGGAVALEAAVHAAVRAALGVRGAAALLPRSAS